MKKNNSTKPRVVVVGAYNADLVVTCERSLEAGKSLIGGPMQIFGGGRGANCAVAAARAECAVTFIGAHGRDGFGGMAQGQLAHESINLDYFFEVPNVKTGTSLSLVESGTGKHLLVCAQSANDHLTPEMIQRAREAILSADLVVSELEIPSDTVWAVMKLCEQHSIPFVLDISPLDRIDSLPNNKVFLLVSETPEEVMRIINARTISETVTELHRLGCRNVVLIEDRRQVIYSDGERAGTISVPIEQIVDRCGATECLETWIALAILLDVPLANACARAVLAMAYSLSRRGGHQSMPHLSEITELETQYR
jgi:ribokinase